jgi:hypothetical protein
MARQSHPRPGARELTISAEWVFVRCCSEHCGRPILVAEISPDMLDANGDLTLRSGPMQLSCSHCQTQATYQPEELRRGRARGS